MIVERPASIIEVLADKIRVPSDTGTLAETYRNNHPFPHIVLDDLFSDDLLRRLVAEIPPIKSGDWLRHDEDQLVQYTMRSAVELRAAGTELVSILHSAAFLYFLSEITGIWQLLPDPYLQGAAVHVIPQGGHFAVHADRNTAYETGLFRKLSMIIYLNEGWRPEYGGQFELWNADGSRRERVVEPIFNRTILFEVADANYHGVPSAVAHPEGVTRKSFMAYYHTAQLVDPQRSHPHTSVYAPSFYRKESPLERVMKDVMPPILRRAAKKLLRG